MILQGIVLQILSVKTENGVVGVTTVLGFLIKLWVYGKGLHFADTEHSQLFQGESGQFSFGRKESERGYWNVRILIFISIL